MSVGEGEVDASASDDELAYFGFLALDFCAGCGEAEGALGACDFVFALEDDEAAGGTAAEGEAAGAFEANGAGDAFVGGVDGGPGFWVGGVFDGVGGCFFVALTAMVPMLVQVLFWRTRPMVSTATASRKHTA